MTQVEVLQSRADQLKALLLQSQGLTQDACSVLDTYRRKLREVDRLVQPIAARANNLTSVRDNLRVARERVAEVQEHLDTANQVEAQVVMGPGHDFGAFLRAFDRLQASIAFLQNHRTIVTSEAVLRGSLKLRDAGVAMVLDHFSALLRQHTALPSGLLWAHDDPAAGAGQGADASPELELMAPGVCKRLRRLAELLLANREERCLSVFCEARRGVWAKGLAGLGQEAAVKDPGVQWGVMQEKIQAWILCVSKAARLLLPERALCASVFPQPAAASAYYRGVEPSMRALLTLGAAICMSTRRLWEKVFGLLDMHEHLQELLPLMATALDDPQLEKVLFAFMTVGKDLQVEARATFAEFVAELGKPSTRDLPPDGSVHRLCVYCLAYLKRLSAYDSAAAILFSDAPPRDLMDRSHRLQDPVLHERMAGELRRVLEALMRAMQARARAYKSKALGALFLMNNLHHVATRVERSEALAVVGDAWLERVKDEVEAQGVEYVEAAWGPLIAAVGQDPAVLGKEKVKDALKALAARVDEVAGGERGWAVPDEALRENLRNVLVQDFVKPYEAFLHKFQAAFPAKVAKYQARYVKYSGADLRVLVFHQLFAGEGGGEEERYRHSDSMLMQVGR